MRGRRGFLVALAAIAAAPVVALRERVWVRWRLIDSTGAVIASGDSLPALPATAPARNRIEHSDDGETWEDVPTYAPSVKRYLRTIPLLLAFLWTQAALAADPPKPVEVSVQAGALTYLGTDADLDVQPMARVLVSLPLGRQEKPGTDWMPIPPALHVQLDLSARPGETVAIEDPGTVRALEARFGISQRLHDALNADLYFEAGFSATRVPGGLEDRGRAVSWAGGGVRIGRLGPGWLSLLLAAEEGTTPIRGADERVAAWKPVVMLAGAVPLYSKDRLLGAHVFLAGDARLELSAFTSDRVIAARIGLVVGR